MAKSCSSKHRTLPKDFVQQKQPAIGEFQTWSQCFAIYAAVLVTRYPTRAQSLFLYSALIARLSKKFRYPSWIVYDITFRQEAAYTGTANWAKVDCSIHTQCFTGMSLCEEGWCALCTALDHTRATCPYEDDQPAQNGKRRPVTTPRTPLTCRKWNRHHYMNCPHGDQCVYAHVCSMCHSVEHGMIKCRRKPDQPHAK